MKLTIAREQLINGLQAVQNVVGSRTTLPILSNVLLQAEQGRLGLTATDLDVSIACGVEAKVEKVGVTTLPARRLFSIVRELGTPEIELEVDEKNVCSLTAGASFFKVNGLPAEDFPPRPGFADSKRVALPQDKVKGMLRRTAFAVSNDEARYVLNGLFFSLREHKVTLVATDGRRLALTDEEVDIGAENQTEFIVPAKTVAELSRLLQDKGEVEISVGDNQVAFDMRGEGLLNILAISKLVEGTYPNYQQVIPRESKERIPLVREELVQALRRAELMTSEKSNSVKLSFTRNTLAITANAPEIGEARETLAINYKGPDLAVAFNPSFLLDALKALDNDEVFLELSDELSPGVLKVNGPFLYVIMPMRMN
ncbi:MAG: DNA polymerase III subunit beta [Verrucomicrobia bacterium]|jgi:DNA polymerase-3 subunit beta|nr:DNA polymerase III subunit beta [Verrucomicrobiota bacterium]OQC62351.1 MAG: DNA polymerase III subunit beta [Verrucomicrobia bacterium ADurb.Bin006]MDI9379859.1 DNA polymerase III subunit beta [Verrucomicrobiota bacterium]NMD21437.1 DNA polymerase III subunit beta [Verrucomicrobiota bacterium]HNU98474.1 DNA polymerase III subunit beta [Verrucomicrobiota bacterium]